MAFECGHENPLNTNTTHNVEINITRIKCDVKHEPWFSGPCGAGLVASGQLDFFGGRGSVILGIGTVKLGFFNSCKIQLSTKHFTKNYEKQERT